MIETLQVDAPDKAKARILVIDDEPQNLRLVEVKLRQEYEVTMVKSGDEALKLLGDGKKFDVILLDQMMPKMDGITTFTKMRRQKLIENVPVIMITAHGSIKLATTFMQIGGADFIEKPIADAETLKLKILHALKTAETMKKHRKMEEELMKIQRLDSISILAGGIAHDFNNILTGVFGNISLAEMYMETENAKWKALERLKEAEKASTLAKDLTQQLLTFSKGGRPVLEVTDIGDLLRDSTAFALRGSNVRCEFFISDNLWLAQIDPGQINQVVSNLIINSQQAMPDGGVVKIYAENISIDTESDLPLQAGAYIKISVEDQGIGISKEHLQRIFDPFFTTKQTGSGLGLATSYSITQKHNGYITVESQIGVGTTFHIYLPASPDAIPKTEEKAEDGITKGTGRILVIDDEEIVRELITDILTNIGYEVGTTVDGNQAAEVYRDAMESGNPFDAVIIDLTIPGGMGGSAAIQKLIEIDPEVKAIVSSGYSTDPIMTNFSEYGFKGVIAKPYKARELSEVLHRVLTE